MKSRINLTVVILVALSAMLSAQTNPLSELTPGKKLKTDLVGSYPQHIDLYNWSDAWSAFGTTDITYRADAQPATIQRADPSGQTKETYSYNSQGMETEILLQKYESGAWVNVEKEVNAYINILYPESSLNYEWNGTDWVLSDGMQYEYTFDGDRISTMLVSYYHHGQDWTPGMRYTYEYEGGNQEPFRVVTELYEDGVWSFGSRTTYEYSNSEISSMLVEAWTNGAWVLSSKMEYTLGNYGSMTTLTYSRMGDQWIPSMRMIQENDEHGNEILLTTEFYMGEWSLLMGQQKDLTYSGNNVTQRITKVYTPFEPGAEASGDQWKNSSMEVFSNFASLNVNVDELVQPEISVYPNPADQKVSITLKGMTPGTYKVQLINLLGQEVAQDEMELIQSGKVEIPVGNLPDGLYFVNVVKNSELVISEKLIIGSK